MCAAALDTLSLFNNFKNVGISKPQAHLFANLFARTQMPDDLVTQSDLNKYVTKSDWHAFKSGIAHDFKTLDMSLGHRFDQVFREIKQICTDTKNEADQIRADAKTEATQIRLEFKNEIGSIKHDLIQWIIGLGLTMVSLMVGFKIFG